MDNGSYQGTACCVDVLWKGFTSKKFTTQPNIRNLDIEEKFN
jgi:hypothetical protein